MQLEWLQGSAGDMGCAEHCSVTKCAREFWEGGERWEQSVTDGLLEMLGPGINARQRARRHRRPARQGQHQQQQQLRPTCSALFDRQWWGSNSSCVTLNNVGMGQLARRSPCWCCAVQPQEAPPLLRLQPVCSYTVTVTCTARASDKRLDHAVPSVSRCDIALFC
jgi:hypothetical protein